MAQQPRKRVRQRDDGDDNVLDNFVDLLADDKHHIDIFHADNDIDDHNDSDDKHHHHDDE